MNFISVSEYLKKRTIFVQCTEGIMLGKVTHIIENKMNEIFSKKQSKKKPRRVGH